MFSAEPFPKRCVFWPKNGPVPGLCSFPAHKASTVERPLFVLSYTSWTTPQSAAFSMRHVALILPLLLAVAAIAAEPPLNREQLSGQVARLLGELNSDRFEVRRTAAEQVEKLIARPELGRGLAVEFQKVLIRPDISFEVRRQVDRWSRRLPTPPAEPAPDASPKELDQLVHQLDDDSYAVRVGTTRRIEWMLSNPKSICPIMLRLKHRLTDGSLDNEGKTRLEALWQQARGAWLSSDVAGRELPAVSNDQIERWLDNYVRPGSTAAIRAAHEAAECELLDLLARDDYVPRLTKAIQDRLAKKPTTEAAASLKVLLDWTKPELVAEFWQLGCRKSQQHLIVGVPTTSTGAARPTCFDRANDHTAHCKSGNSLTPGDYPVGLAYPHPRLDDAFFQFVNLPTPRRRMAYMSCVNSDDAKCLARLSRRTLDAALADKRILNERDLVMLDYLDPVEVSRFAGLYFLAVNDDRLGSAGPRRIGGRPSRFGMICATLAGDGTKEAVPGLLEAIAKNRFQPPTLVAPLHLELLAALSIASRDPWLEVDAWLADRIDQTKLLMEGQPSAAEIGATAAAILLKRHQRTPENFGLEPAPDGLPAELHVDGYRFAGEEMRKSVKEWWAQERARKSL
jgi:hypothetical protein